MTRTRSASWSASSTSWVTSRTDGSCSRHSLRTSWCISNRVSASSALNGSSSSSRPGALTSARASETRWAWPPDSVTGHTSCFSASPTSSSPARARRRRSSRLPSRRARATLSPTRFQGSRRGCWNATETTPSTSTLPWVTGSSPASVRSSVDLPEPLRPRTATSSPGAMSRSRCSRTTWSPNARRRSRTRTRGGQVSALSGVVAGGISRVAMPVPSSRWTGPGRRCPGRAGCRSGGRRRRRRCGRRRRRRRPGSRCRWWR